MLDSEIHIGDVLRIRSFEDMKSEFGADKDGNIFGTNVYFLAGMSNLCGKEFTVSGVVEERYGYRYQSLQGVEDRGATKPWIIQSWMLEPYTDTEEFYVASDEELSLLLC